jgi:hypothetical protein
MHRHSTTMNMKNMTGLDCFQLLHATPRPGEVQGKLCLVGREYTCKTHARTPAHAHTHMPRGNNALQSVGLHDETQNVLLINLLNVCETVFVYVCESISICLRTHVFHVYKCVYKSVKCGPNTYRLRDCAEHFLHLPNLGFVLQEDRSVEVRHLRHRCSLSKHWGG